MTRPKLNVLHWLLIATNVSMALGYVSTYINNIYFQLWVNSISTPMLGIVTIVSAVIGLFAGFGFFYEKLQPSYRAKIQRALTPLEEIGLRNPLLVTGGVKTE